MKASQISIDDFFSVMDSFKLVRAGEYEKYLAAKHTVDEGVSEDFSKSRIQELRFFFYAAASACVFVARDVVSAPEFWESFDKFLELKQLDCLVAMNTTKPWIMALALGPKAVNEEYAKYADLNGMKNIARVIRAGICLVKSNFAPSRTNVVQLKVARCCHG